MSKTENKYSVNERAEKIVGRRDEYLPENTIIFDFPTELGYQCPVHKSEFDEGLEWSEYRGFIWCGRCNKDYPSALCHPDIDRAISVYLDTIEEAIGRSKSTPVADSEINDTNP